MTPSSSADPNAEPSLVLARLPVLVLALWLVGLALVAVLAQGPPPARDASAPAAELSAERAMAHVDALAATPRPIGSAAHARARDHLVRGLEALGLEVEVQRAPIAVESPRLPRLLEVENVVARLAGRDPSTSADTPRAVLLVAHYDSVIGSPGAADNAAAVAALLETARALVAGEPLAHDVIFLFTDAEEYGLAGARAFLDHPWAHEVAVVANFEARGHRGPVYMFETGDANGVWVPRFLDAAPRPVANSLMSQVYRRLPNDTDFSVFRDAGTPGFNFAFIGGLDRYHGSVDTPEALDRRSLQHHGETALALARRLADLDTVPPADGETDRVYFNVFGGATVHYPGWLAGLVSLLAAVIVLAALVRGLRAGRLRASTVALGGGAFLVAVVVVPLTVTLLWIAVRDLGGVPVRMGSTPAASWFMASFAALAVAFFVLATRLARRLVPALDLAAGALLVGLVPLALTSGLGLPIDCHFLFAWPLLGAGGTLFWLLGHDADELTTAPWRTVTALALGAVPTLLLLPPFVGPAYTGLQGLFGLGGPPLVLVVFALGFLLPSIEALGLRRDRAPWAVPLAVGLALWVPAFSTPQPPPSDHLMYALDLGSPQPGDEQALWLSVDRPPAEYLHELGLGPTLDGETTAPIPRFFPWSRRPLAQAPAAISEPSAGTVGPEIVAIRETDTAVEVDVELGAGGFARSLWLEPAGTVARVVWRELSVSLGEPVGERVPILRQMPASATRLTLVFDQRSADSLQAIELVVVDQVDALPADTPARPEHHTSSTPFEFLPGDTSLVRRAVTLSSASHQPDQAPFESSPADQSPGDQGHS